MKALSAIPIDKALLDAGLLGAALGEPATWAPWIAVLRAAFALPMTEADLATFNQVAGGREVPESRVRELWAIVGRRSGKSRMAAAVAAYMAAFAIDHSKLSPGEVGTVLVLAASKSQASAVHNYVRAFFQSSPYLRSMLLQPTADEIRLSNGIVIAVHSSSYKTVRGRTLVACVFDETAFWRDESSSQPDVESYRAILPALATTKGLLVAISSPYRQAGLLYSKFQDAYGQNIPNVLRRQGSYGRLQSDDRHQHHRAGAS
ncbi:hypothetical protein [Mesorhizobium sp. M0847]|uniref:hypothetical protein n=1 Tax=unclassified Mesorhizobium TaxID=325217 RepID=UPI003338DEA3